MLLNYIFASILIFFRSNAIKERIFTSSWWVFEKCIRKHVATGNTARRNFNTHSNTLYLWHHLSLTHSLPLSVLSFPVPPMIVEGSTSNDMVVREGSNVTLVCKAKGYPEPYVRKFIYTIFYRDDFPFLRYTRSSFVPICFLSFSEILPLLSNEVKNRLFSVTDVTHCHFWNFELDSFTFMESTVSERQSFLSWNSFNISKNVNISIMRSYLLNSLSMQLIKAFLSTSFDLNRSCGGVKMVMKWRYLARVVCKITYFQLFVKLSRFEFILWIDVSIGEKVNIFVLFSN